MPNRSWPRILWVALIPVAVSPLYGQMSCDPCPDSANPCQRAAGRSTETNQCVYVNQLDGAACDAQGAAGECFDGQCEPTSCAGVSAFAFCGEPEGGGSEGICMDFRCIASGPEDPCVKPGVGRVNCCEDEGCNVASGAYCSRPVDDGVSCDPTGIEPWGGPGQDGICVAGTCVAQSGACAGLSCPTILEEQCAREYCNPQTGQCQEWWLDAGALCLAENAPGFCRAGRCNLQNGEECNGQACVSDACVSRACVYPCAETGDRQCTIMDYFDETPSCRVTRIRENGERCDGEPGTCLFGSCALAACANDAECQGVGIENPCADSVCGPVPGAPSGGLCGSVPKADGTSCGETPEGQVLAICENGQCFPDLCIDVVCDDGDPCTNDNCVSPYGFCPYEVKDDGESCDGEPGQCINGNCVPVITPECDHQPFDPDRSFPECDDGNECTFNRCDFADQCINPPIEFVAPCGPFDRGLCFNGNCVILP